MNNLEPINKRYLLCINIKSYCDEKGNTFFDDLWYKDLKEHSFYLKNFKIACPCEHKEPPTGSVYCNADSLFSSDSIIALPSPNSFLEAIIMLPITIAKLWQAISEADIVHTCVVGWPIPLGFLITPMVKLQGKFYVIIVESANWRLQAGTKSSMVTKIKAYIDGKLAQWCVNSTDLAIFTQKEYQKSLLTKPGKQGYIIQASWIDEANIISDSDAKAIWNHKVTPSTQALKVIFVGRLVTNKGILVLLEAMNILDKEASPVELDILGEGEQYNACEKSSQNLKGKARIKLLGKVPYDSNFFKILQNYHAIVVPSLSDEQPRVVYDAYSQGLPILGCDNPGTRQCVEEQKNGFLTEPNDPRALANLLKYAYEHLNELETLGLAGLDLARKMTHQEMHRQRWQLLLETLNK